MRTTIELPNELFRQVKSQAASRGETLKAFFQATLEKEISSTARPGSLRIRLPLIKSKAPKTLSLTSAEIENLLA